MYCFRKNKDVIEKYNIVFDQQKLEELKKEIINNCSIIEHFRFESDYQPYFDNFNYIINYQCIPTDKYKEYDVECRNINCYTYDELKPPYLVELIEHLKDGSVSYLKEIIDYDITDKNEIDVEIDKTKEELIKSINEEKSEYEREQLNKKLEKLLVMKKLNQNRAPIAPYHKRLLELIKFELIDVITIDEITRVSEFLENNLLKKYHFINSDNEEINKKLIRKID